MPGTRREAEHLARLPPGATPLTGAAATRSAVVSALPRHAYAHFSCHAPGDPGRPSGSLLALHDHVERPLTVRTLRDTYPLTPSLWACQVHAGPQVSGPAPSEVVAGATFCPCSASFSIRDRMFVSAGVDQDEQAVAAHSHILWAAGDGVVAAGELAPVRRQRAPGHS
ncbi:CHAT domain-containing protein [Streptomyces sp. NPDC127117]|uniref:CHAT domain-containing protein n=1 Tax=Streptomyces sp. NPDC127117 TaxID=3345368 RepID=UPI00363781B0